jgi:hypothetical protein
MGPRNQLGAATVALLLLFMSAGAGAQNNGGVKIQVKYHEFLEQVRPVAKAFLRNQDIEVTLHNGNQVTERRSSSRPDGQTVGQAESEGVFGSAASSGRMIVNWRVSGRNSLVRNLEGPQHIEVLRINVSGHSCTASVSYSLKPGFREYLRTPHGELHYFSSIQATVDSCVIE